MSLKFCCLWPRQSVSCGGAQPTTKIKRLVVSRYHLTAVEDAAIDAWRIHRLPAICASPAGGHKAGPDQNQYYCVPLIGAMAPEGNGCDVTSDCHRSRHVKRFAFW